jgi:hypothetical protein
VVRGFSLPIEESEEDKENEAHRLALMTALRSKSGSSSVSSSQKEGEL